MAPKREQPSPGSVPALFLHIQKTAGTSIVDLAQQFYGESLVSHGDCWLKSPEELRQTRFVSGHIGYDFARRYMEGRYSFTFLRDPVERVLSMYYFMRNRDPDEFVVYRLAQELGLPEFLEAGFHDPWVRSYIWNNQVWQLAHGFTVAEEHALPRVGEDGTLQPAREYVGEFGEDELLSLAQAHLAEFSQVGFTETFDADAAPILAALGLPRVDKLPQLNATPGRPRTSEQSPAVRDLLHRLTELDRELYAHARSLQQRSTRWWRR